MNGSRQEAINSFITKVVQSSVTRPADTTQYAAGDVIADGDADAIFTFSGAVRGAQQPPFGGAISTAICISSANQATKPDLELWLFAASPTLVADNSAFSPSDAELLTLLGVIPFPVAEWLQGNAASGADGNACCVKTPGLVIKGNSTDLFGVLVVRNTYTPVSAEAFTIKLVVTQD